MKKTTRRPSPGITVRMQPKRLVDQRCLPPGSVLIDRVFDRKLGRFEDPDDEPQIEGNFYLDPEEAPPPSRGVRQEAMTAVVGATFEAAASPDQRRRLRHGQAMCVIVLVPTPAWILPTSIFFRSAFGDRWVQQTRDASHVASTGSSAVSGALSSGQSVVGICADVSLLAATLVGAADATIRLTAPTGAVLQTAIGRFTKRPAAAVEDSIAVELDLDDIVAAFRPGSGPQRIVQRLAAAAAALRVHRDLKKERQPCSS
ncbi:hypothetical protein QA633_40155 [Bradyrhizobium barranii]|uniref:hypothetical protein n=1 Tax=Bradyrhizobium barranii TaxID=2992140 RepID=UPI0024AFF92E|nr:hypothetical protein [Bradyrhizobium barranii]WFT94405.1 hypothetical protein QA633_40155 [Bradyrhizobium barranii]